MAISLVQQDQQAPGGSTTGFTFTLSAPTNGNVVVVGFENNAANPTMAGTGVTWTRHYQFSGDANHDNFALFTGIVGASASATQSMSYGACSNNAAIFAEFSGVQQVVDGTPPTSTDVSSSTPSVTSNTPSVAGDLAVAFCGQTSAIAPTGTPSGWTTLTAATNTRRVDGAYFDLGGSSSAVTPQWTFAASKFALLGIVLIKTPATAAAFPNITVVDTAVARASSW